MTPSDLAGLCERLRERAASYRLSGPSAEHTAAILDEAAAAIESLTAEVEEARRLMEPFALLAADEVNDVKGVSMSDPISRWLTIAHLQNARAFLTKRGG